MILQLSLQMRSRLKVNTDTKSSGRKPNANDELRYADQRIRSNTLLYPLRTSACPCTAQITSWHLSRN